METWYADVEVLLKPSVNDPPGQSIRTGLHALGFPSVHDVRAGKLFRLTLEAPSEDEARQQVQRMCELLLANPVTETFTFQVSSTPPEQ